MSTSLHFLAGPKAYRHIQEKGLHPNDVAILAGAAGGPKWIVLQAIDKYLFGEWFAGRKQPLHLVGSSIGAWRFAAAMAFSDPVKGLKLLKEAYFSQAYSRKPSPQEISDFVEEFMQHFIHEQSIPHILNHPYAHLQILTARAKGLLASERKSVQIGGMLGAIALNALRRSWLGACFQRVVFEDPRARRLLFDDGLFQTLQVDLTEENFRQALLATGSIPVIMEGVRDIPEAPAGMYRDGGVTDYHLTFPYELAEDKIVLMPHFFRDLKPSWFDRPWKWRGPNARMRDHLLLIYPSRAFTAQLPGGDIPQRKDFTALPTDTRIARWEQAYAMSEVLVEELKTVLSSGEIAKRMRPF